MRKPVIYQVLTRLWKEGRFSSFDSASFDYFRSLGITHLWFTGIVRHASGEVFVKGDPGSPYAVSDYYDTNPYLADNTGARLEEFAALVRRSHNEGFRVIIDFVPNHVACNYGDTHGDIPLLGYCDYDWTDTVKINYDSPLTLGRLRDILLFWAAFGVDGFRCDMVELVPKDAFRQLIHEVRREFPDLIFIAEVYNRSNYRSYIEEVGVDCLYDKSGLYDELKKIIKWNGTTRSISWNWQFLGDLQPHMLNFLENHDEQRLACPDFAGSPERGYAALATGLLLNTAPYMIYFGQEGGEAATDSWNYRTSIFEWARKLGPAPEDSPVLKTYRELLMKASEPVFSEGLTYDLCYCQLPGSGFDMDRHFAFLRGLGGHTELVVCNFTEKPSEMNLLIPKDACRYLGAALPGSVAAEVPACGYVTVRIS